VQPFHEIQIVVNGEIVARERTETGALTADLRCKAPLRGSAWIAARCISRHQVWHGWPIHIAAHTSPVYVVTADAELFSPSDATYMLTLIDGGLTWLDTLSIPASPERQAAIRGVFEAAQAELQHRLGYHEHLHKPLLPAAS
jgi:hypothetical protein